jgi:hypothetical protein
MDKEEVQRMIDDAIRQHNIQATLISAILGFTVMAFYAHGVITLVK